MIRGRAGLRHRLEDLSRASCLLVGMILFTSSSLSAPLDLDEIYGSTKHDDPKLPRIQWLGAGEEYLLEREDEDGKRRWYRVETVGGEERLWLDPHELFPAGQEASLEVDHVEFSSNGSLALLSTERERRWRRSHFARLWVFSVASGELRELDPQHSPQMHAQFSPDARQVAYVHDGDLYLEELASAEVRALTTDGGGTVRNGDPDWVYEEELDYSAAFWWSPDGRRLAFLRSDDAGVEDYPLVHTGDAAVPRLEMLRYAIPGGRNPEVKLGIIEVEGGGIHWVREYGQAGYLARAEWLADGRLLLQELDRSQSTLRILELPPDDTTPRLLLEERSKGWISARSDLHFLDDGRFFRVSADDGFAHVYLHTADGKSERQITRGRWEVLRLLAVDERGGQIVVQTDRGDRAQRHLDLVALHDGRVRRLSGSGGWHRANFDPSGRRYLERWSSLDGRPQLLLREADGTLLRRVHEASMADLDLEALGQVRFLVIPGAEGEEMSARLILPADFDATRRYPVLIYCYGAPGSQLVRDRWGGKGELFHRLLVQQGILVLSVDNRGTRGRGEDFLFSVYRRLGQLESEDQIAAARWLGEQSYVDAERIGIWGWSYGGYLSAMTLLRGEGLFAGAVSVAPVSDWTLYDSIYTERYMGTPQDNAEGYHEGSLLSHVDELQSSLFLLHGAADDNVHLQNTMRLAATLQEAGKPFEMMIYPDQDHGIEDEARQLHLRRSILEYLLRRLAPPEELGPDTE